MGGGSTKILSYDDAVKRFLPADLERIENTFRDLTNGTGELSYANFKRDVFANFLPEKLATRLYQVCMSSSKSCMSMKDFVSCLALIYYGSTRERIQLLYVLFTHNTSNSNGILRRQDVEDFLSQCGDPSPEELDTLFQNSDAIVTQERFVLWLESHHGHTTTITDWLMDDQRLHELTNSLNDRTSDQYSIFANVTNLKEIEVKDLEKSYNSICTYSNTNRQSQIVLQTFSNILTPVLPPILITGFFDAFDENQDGCIDFKEFICGISSICRGQQIERHKFLFRVFDRDHDGRLDRSDIVHMCSCLISVAQFVNKFNFQMNDSPDVYAEKIFENTERLVFTCEDFSNWCTTDMFIPELIDLIYQICHIVLGLRPLTRHDEVFIVKEFLQRELYPFIEAQSCVSSKTYHWINLNRSTSKPGSSWYLIPSEWWNRWEMSTTNATMNKKTSASKSHKSVNGLENKREPGDIDTSSLVDKNSSSTNRIVNDECVQLKSGLRYPANFQMVPEILWLFLRKYYRCNGPVVCRKVTYRKKLNRPELDLYPFLIKVYRNQSLSQQQLQSIANTPSANTNTNSMYFVYPLMNFVSASVFGSSNSSTTNPQRHYLTCSYFVSPYQTVRSLTEEFSNKFGKTLEEIHLWLRFSENDLRQIDIDNNELTCEEAGFECNTDILLEIRNNDLTWPEELYTLATRSKPPSSTINENERGLIGLSNLGNTCFLNASVQCLSHSFPLTYYFLHKYYLYEINKDNPIGMQGNIALRYGQLLAKLWGNVQGPLAPFELRDSVAKFGSSRFTDFQQHDSQEFLSFLLDGLHEDLNRVHTKPYVELKDSDDRPDEDVASEHWANHLARNTSIIVDLFHGLLRSQVQCRTCQLKSVRFDPFNILSLPLPVDTTIAIDVKLIRSNGSIPIRYSFRLDGNLSVMDLKSKFVELSNTSIEQIGFYELTPSFHLRPNSLLENNSTSIKSLPNREILAYELDPKCSSYIIARHRRIEKQDRYLSPMTKQKIVFFGQPLLIPYDENLTNDVLYGKVYKQIDRLLRKNQDFDEANERKEVYPFVLKHISEDGKKCSLCSWNRFCIGCSIESNAEKFNYSNDYLAIDWEPTAYYLRYLSNREQDIEIYQSIKSAGSSNVDPNQDDPNSVVHLEDCLDSFTRWENLDTKELFNCKKCQQLQPANKKLDIWKLPPCLIFHIKRFQLSNNRWIKSSRPVRFPINEFNPSKYLPTRTSICSISAEFRSINDNMHSSSTSSLSSEAISTSSTDNMNGLSYQRNLTLPPPEKIQETKKNKKKKSFSKKSKHAQQESTEEVLLPPRFSQMENRTLSFGDNSFDPDHANYNLYALVCHYGVIGSGHYVSFIKNHETKQWYCLNDSSCKPVSESFLEKCSSSAYLLFYQRENLDCRRYMPDVEGKQRVANENSLPADDRWCSIM